MKFIVLGQYDVDLRQDNPAWLLRFFQIFVNVGLLVKKKIIDE